MITIRTNTSRLRTAAGDLISGALTVTPSASFEYTDGGERRKVAAVPIVVLIQDGVLAEDLVLAPTKGAAHDRVNLTYRAIFTVSGNRLASWTEFWELDAAGAAVLEIDEVTQVSVSEQPAYVALAGAERAMLHTQGTDQVLDQGGPNEVTAAALKGHLADVANPHAVTAQQVGADATGTAAAAVAAHVAAVDPHPGYATDVDLSSHLLDVANPHAVTAAQVGADPAGTAAAALAAHEGAADPHAGYQLEAEKGQANGYASLDGTGKVPAAQLPASGSGIALDQVVLGSQIFG